MRLPSAHRLFSLVFLTVAPMCVQVWLAPALMQCVASQPAFAQSAWDDNREPSAKQKKQAEKKEEAAQDQLTEQERKDRLRSFKKEVSRAYQNWLNEDVVYIITPEEEKAFKLLGTDEERDAFIDQFWQRRNPNPDSEENEFREEHYRRFQYANEHFGAGTPGWKTDRGHMYIVWGPPDDIESHPAGGTYQRPMQEGGGTTSTYPFERWRYRHLDGIGDNIVIEFVDSCQCNDYHIALSPNEKDALAQTGGGATLMEQLGFGDPTARMAGIPGAVAPFGNAGNNQFDALERYAKLTAPPPVRFKDLEEKIDTHIRYNLMPFDVRTDFVKITDETVLVPITIQIQTGDMTFVPREGIQRAAVNIFGRISTLSGRVAKTFEDTVGVDEPNELLEKAKLTKQVYWKAIPLKPGMYKLDLALKDVNGDRVGTFARSIRVPGFDDEKLSSSSLILADLMERVASKNIGSGSFILGDTKVRPRPDSSDGKPATFHRDQRLNIWMQVYNLQQDQQTHRTHATIHYQLVNMQTNKSVLDADESSDAYGGNNSQITIEKSMGLMALDPGLYNLKITINDEIAKQTITPSSRFQVQ